jgi:hypothetical protein
LNKKKGGKMVGSASGSSTATATATAALSGLQDHLKLAREYALGGLYDTSIIFFDGAIAQIIKYLKPHPPFCSLYINGKFMDLN